MSVSGPTSARKGPWPEAALFNEAVQNLRTSTADKELQGGEPEIGPLGVPMPYAGNFADVYKVYCPTTRNTWAVKFFKREVRDLRERYRAISDHLIASQLPFMADFRYLDEGVRIGGAWYPLVKMRWIEGLSLNRFVAQSLGQPKMLDQLFNLWVKLAARLRGAGIAHADLQHGNVVLVPEGDQGKLLLKLIDYDGMYVPALAGQNSSELGHANYQHPQREVTRAYNAELDRFSHLAICCALRCVAVGGSSLWERFNNDENLIFTAQDFKQPAASLLFRELSMLRHPDAKALVGHLILATQAPLEQTPLIDELVQEGQVRRLTADQVQQVYALLRGETIAVPARDSGSELSPPSVIPLARAVDSPAGTVAAQAVPAAVPVADPPPKRRNFAAAALLGIGWLLVAIVRGVDWLLGTAAGQGNVLLHNYFRVIFLIVTVVGVPWTTKVVTSFVQVQLERARIQKEIAASEALEQDLADTQSAWITGLEASDPELLELHAAEPFLAAQQEAELALALKDAGDESGALQSFREALALLGQAKTTAARALATELEIALAEQGKPDAKAAEKLLATIKQLNPGETRLANWQTSLETLGVASLESDEGPLEAARPSGEVITNSIGMKLVAIPAGDFWMGSSDDGNSDADERPRHRVRISREFFLGKYEVTQAQYRAVMGGDPSKFNGDDLPVEQVSAKDVDKFCRLLTEKERQTGELAAGESYRLPTEAEWEYAARAGSTSPWFFGGNQKLKDYAWYDFNSFGQSRAVGQKQPNAWGLYDMAGNVAEWVLDEHQRDAYAKRAGRITVDPRVQGPKSEFRVTRGGSWNNSAQSCRCAFRSTIGVNFSNPMVGFRVVRERSSAGNKTAAPAPKPAVEASPRAPIDAITSSIGMRLVKIPAGRFEMGSSGGAANERPPHQVEITRDFYLGMFEVTQQEYQEVTDKSSSFGATSTSVDNVSAEDAEQFCRLLTAVDAAAGKLRSGMVYRLPTEAQWEYAARAGTTTQWFCGSSDRQLDGYAWHLRNARGKTHAPGEKLPNPWGLYDMAGNVEEWVADGYQADGYQSRTGSATSDPFVPQRKASGFGISTVLGIARGGSCRSSEQACRSAARRPLPTNTRLAGTGFRVALVEASLPGDLGESTGGSATPSSAGTPMGGASPVEETAFPKLPPDAGKIDDDAAKTFSTTQSGHKYRILRKGKGKTPMPGDKVKVSVDMDRNVRGGGPVSWSSLRQQTVVVGGPARYAIFSDVVQLVAEGGLIELQVFGNSGSGRKAARRMQAGHFLIEVKKIE
jgi:formylglycine-generating enzyme required for sulfatase activity